MVLGLVLSERESHFVVHCVRVPLTGAIVAEFWACGSLAGIGFCTFFYSMYNIVDIGGPSIIVT